MPLLAIFRRSDRDDRCPMPVPLRSPHPCQIHWHRSHRPVFESVNQQLRTLEKMSFRRSGDHPIRESLAGCSTRLVSTPLIENRWMSNTDSVLGCRTSNTMPFPSGANIAPPGRAILMPFTGDKDPSAAEMVASERLNWARMRLPSGDQSSGVVYPWLASLYRTRSPFPSAPMTRNSESVRLSFHR